MQQWEHLTWRVEGVGAERAAVIQLDGRHLRHRNDDHRLPFYQALTDASTAGWEHVGTVSHGGG
ncbi:MAG: hypothetical protein M3O34_13010 [Chloroflexota bacterium]|nr:hypothetical protein [Chloroflexota bacterium]